MIFPKPQQIHLNLDQNFAKLNFLHAKAAIIDRRRNHASPLVYILSPDSIIEGENLQSLKSRFLYGFSEGSFILLGHLVNVERHKKQLKLTDDRVVAYDYLISINQRNHQLASRESDLYFGLSALIDALRIQKKQLLFHEHHGLPSSLGQKNISKSIENARISKPKNPLLPISDSLFQGDFLLCEVQT